MAHLESKRRPDPGLEVSSMTVAKRDAPLVALS